MSNEKISHKELLTFSNLTSLEWEFVPLEAIKEGEGPVGGEETSSDELSTQLNDLLIPGVFQRIVKEKKDEKEVDDGEDLYEEKRKYIYGGEGYGEYDEEQGLVEMRKEAGIAMEYNEKDEGKFLEDWEVVYGADRYKIITEYVDERLDPLREMVEKMIASGELQKELESDESLQDYKDFIEKNNYSLREDLRDAHETKIRMEFSSKVWGEVLNIFGTGVTNSGMTQLVPKKLGKKILKKAVKKGAIEQASNLNERLGYIVELATAGEDIFSVNYDQLGNQFGQKEIEKVQEGLKEIAGLLKDQAEEEAEITLLEELNIYDEARYEEDQDEFRVVVLKKDKENNKDDIVIAYQGEQLENKKILPDELECLQMVYSKVVTEHPEAEITFTGVNGGADLSFVNTLFAGKERKYIFQDGDTLEEIAENLFGDSQLWRSNLKKADSSTFTEKEARNLKEGQPIYYCPVESGRLKKATLFYENIEDLQQYVNFTEKNIDSDYNPIASFSIKAVGTEVEEVLLQRIRSGILAAMVISLQAKLMQTISSNQYLFSFAFHTLNFASFICGMGPVGLKTFSALLAGGSALSAALIKITILGFVSGVAVGLTCLAISTLMRWWHNLELKNFYDQLKEIGYINTDRELIDGYITDDFLNQEALEVVTKNGDSVKVKKEYGLFIKREVKQENLNLSDLQGHFSSDKNLIVQLPQSFFDHTISSVSSAWDSREAFEQTFLRFAQNDNEVYDLKSIITVAPSGWESIKALGNMTLKIIDDTIDIPFFSPDNSDLDDFNWYEWDLCPESMVERRIQTLEENENNLTEAEKEELEKLQVKEEVLLDVADEIGNYERLAHLMEMLGKMQRTYEQKAEDVFEFLYPARITKFVSSNTESPPTHEVKITKGIPDSSESPALFSGEFAFLPFIDKNGNIDEKDPKLREEYKASLFKSLLLYYLELDLFGMYRSLYHEDINIKFGFDELPANYSLKTTEFIEGIVGDGDINEKFLEVLETIDPIKTIEIYGKEKDLVLFNHYNNFLEDVREDPEILEDYYQVKETDEYGWGSWIGSKLSNIKAELILNPMSEEESVLEYKYNPNDYIVGGELELTVKDVPEEVAKKIESAPDYPVLWLAKAAAGEIDTGNLAQQLAEKVGHSMEFEKSDRSVKDIAEKIKQEQDDEQEEDSGEPTRIAINRLLPVNKRRKV